MSKLVVVTLGLVAVGALAFATVSGPAEAADAPCSRKKFETKLVEKACKEGGKKAAMRAMVGFVRDVKKAKKAAGDEDYNLKCDACHSKVGGDYPNNKNAVKDFRKLKAFLDKQKK